MKFILKILGYGVIGIIVLLIISVLANLDCSNYKYFSVTNVPARCLTYFKN